MKFPARILSIVALLCAFTSTFAASHKEISVSWDELTPIVQGRNVMIATLSGVLIEGQVLAVRQDHLVMDIEETSDEGRIAKGQQEVPRSNVTVIQFKTVEGSGRLTGAVAGAAGGAVAGWALAEGVFHSSGEGEGVFSEPEGVASILGIGAGAGIAGYFLGRDADTTITYVTIRP